MDRLHPEATEGTQFLKALHDYHKQRGTDFKFAPKICGQEVDLHALYKTVTAAGGSGKINEKPERWFEISYQMRFPERCPNSTLVLRQIYQRYLGSYEKVTFLGEDPDMEVEDMGDMTSSSFRASRTSTRGGGANSSAIVIQVPMTYNRQQHEVTDGQRANFGLSTQFAPPVSPFERLCFSLQSGLPNEETFALNVCTLLANGGRHAMQLDKAPPRLINLLVAQTGLPADDGTLLDMLNESWCDCDSRRMQRFWQEHVDPAVGRCFGIEPLEKYAKIVESKMTKDSVDLIAEGGFMATKDEMPDEDDLFNLDSEVSPRDAESQRVLRIALILHNLSFDEANAQILSQNQGFLRLMMLSSLSRWASLRQVGLDCLSNIAPHLQLNVHDDMCSRSLLRLTVDGILKSEDRGLVIRCLDILAHLAQCENNQETLVAELDEALFDRLLELLTVHDVLLIIHSLETLFALTELGDGICERLVALKHVIGVLVSMLSLDPISYGASAQRGMKVVEHYDPLLPVSNPVVSQGSHVQVGQVIVAPSPVASAQVARVIQPNSGAQIMQQSVAAVPASGAPTGQETTVSDTEALALAWIRAHCELTPGASILRQDLYTDYVQFCSRAGKRSVLSAQHFSTCIKNIYPQAALKFAQVTNPNQQNAQQVLQYDNLRRRATPLPVTPTVTSTVTTQVSRNIQKAALGTTKAALPEGAQSATATPARTTPPTSTTHMNGVLDEKEPLENLAKSDLLSKEPLKSNGNVESPTKVYKSSPLLNGLLDRGTPTVMKAINGGEKAEEKTKINGDCPLPDASASSRKRTFSSEDSSSQEDLMEKDGKTIPKSMQNGIVDETDIKNNNDQNKKIKLSQPSIKTNGAVKEDIETKQVEKTEESNGTPKEDTPESSNDVDGETVKTEDKAEEKDLDKTKDEKAVEKKVLRYYCEWKGCDKSFPQSRNVFLHTINEHIGGLQTTDTEPGKESLLCEWGIGSDKESCDGMIRRRLSLCTHVQERHCSENFLQIQAIRRQQISQFGTASLPAPQQPPPHPGYAPDAAAHAIRRHAHAFYQYKDAADEKEHPITKSVRLTAALILRNLAKYAPECRKQLIQFEFQLAQVAMSSLESSRTIAQCLADIHVLDESLNRANSVSIENNQLFQEDTRPRFS